MIRFSLRYYALTALFFIFSIGTVQAKKPTDNERKQQVATKLFADGNWKKLEQILTDSLESRKRTKTEVAIFRCYTLGADISLFKSPDKPKDTYDLYYKKLNEWKTAFPESIFTKPLEIRYWVSKAYDERGDDYTGTTPPAGWIGFEAGLEKAAKIFEDCTAEGAYLNPSLYGAANYLSLGQKWELDEIYEKIKRPVIDNYPWYHWDLIRHFKAYHSGGGEAPDLLKYYNRVTDDMPEEYSDMFYASCILYKFSVSITDYTYLMDMDLIESGANKLIARSTDNCYHLERTLRFFDIHEGPAATYERYNKIKANYGNKESFKKLVAKSVYLRGIEAAMKIGHEGYDREIQYRPSEARFGGTSRRINGIEHLKKLDLLICSMCNDGVNLIEKETGETIDYKRGHYWTIGVIVSPDEKYVATKAIEYSSTVNVFTIIVYEIGESSLTKVAEYKVDKGLRSFAFGPKGETIYFFKRSDDKLTSTFNSWEWRSEAKPNVIYTYQEPEKPNYSSKMQYLPLSNEILFTAETSLYTYDLASKEVKVHKADPRIKGYLLSVDTFADGRYLAAVTFARKSKAVPQLYIFDTQSKALLQHLPMKISPKTKQVYKIKTQKGQNENEWDLTSSGADNGVARWKLSLVDDQFELTLSSYNVINGYGVYSMAVEADKVESPMYIGDEMGLIGVWKDSE